MPADPREPVVSCAAANLSAGIPVLLVVAGSVVSHAAIARAAELAAGTPVIVVGVGRNDLSRTSPHGSSRPAVKTCWGEPSPSPGPAGGPEPETHRADEEPEQVRRAVALALSALENTGVVAKVRIVTGSPAAKYPSATATIGLTYAWLETRVAGMCASSHTNAVNASRDPITIR